MDWRLAFVVGALFAIAVGTSVYLMERDEPSAPPPPAAINKTEGVRWASMLAMR